MSKVLNFTGNRGEWSEPYTLLYILSNPNLVFCSSNLTPATQNQFRINSIEVPADSVGGIINFSFLGQDVIANFGSKTSIVSQSTIQLIVKRLFSAITTATSTTFSFHSLDQLWSSLLDPEIKSVNSIKYDIRIEITDTATKFSKKYGFSIKSNLGSATSLLNASQQTNFSYSLNSSISLPNPTPKKLGKAVKSLQMSFGGADSQIYKSNLSQIDQDLEEIIMYSLLEYYGSNRKNKVIEILNLVKSFNPLSYPNLNKYDDIFALFLEATAFGMVPNSTWSNSYGADGGMLVVTKSGVVVCFFLPDVNSNKACKNYLLENSYFDTASTSRHGFGSLIGGTEFKLNLLIRL